MLTQPDLRTFLLADPTIAGLVGTRMYPVQLPQDPTHPSIRYTTISGLRTHSRPGVRGLSRPRVQIDCYGSTYAAARQLAEAVAARLDAYRGPAGASRIQGAFFANEDEFYEPDQKAYNVSTDYFIWSS